ncbi:MAG: RNA polymerase-associated protein RapA [Gammaproteobacteria bacterium]|nr:MAG: RNA polymerase-associated protein RapA [Gammaproteobacteria bacterium]
MTDFAIGQRWLSENETELGLGIVERVDHRLVGVFFPATEEQRNYAISSAPLARVRFQKGQSIETSHGEQFTIQSVENLNGTLVYMVTDPQNSDKLLPLPETQLSHKLELDQASDRLFSGQVDSLKWFQLRYSAMQAKSKLERSPVLGLQGPRVDLIPHQLYIASEVGARFAPRVLLSDEVGLGKTIEAGMILHQQLLSHRAQRVLIIVPQSLIHQWFVEMYRRFNLHFHIFDDSRIDALKSSLVDEFAENVNAESELLETEIVEENIYLSEQLVLCSTETMASCDIDEISQGEWDLLIIDEAHHLQWSNEKASIEYINAEKIALQTPGLLLLSATPEQLGIESHFARLRLLDPNRFYDLEAFKKEQEDYEDTAEQIEELTAFETEESKTDTEKQIKDLLDQNGTGRVVFRNTRNNVSGFPKREITSYALDSNETYNELLKNNSLENLSGFDELAQAIHPETRFEDDQWCPHDPRVAWLKKYLKEHRNDKVVIICASKETAINLDLYCRFKLGINCCTFHEDMDLISRDRAAAHFADFEDGARAIICSEIGSEGRNFQFSHQLVLLDLPLNPDLLEQRIGRLDRIGQKNTIQIHVPFIKNSAQEILFNWYQQGMNAFRRTNPAGTQIFLQTGEELKQKLKLFSIANLDIESNEFADLYFPLIEKTQTIHQELCSHLEKGKDKLLAMTSFNQEKADELVKNLEKMDEISPQEFMQQTWHRFGVDFEDHSEKAIVIRPGDHQFVANFPSLPEEGLTATFDRTTALSRDDMHFLTWEHPMVIGAIDLILNENKGNASVCILKNKGIKAGTILIESLFKLESIAPKYLQAQRFLPFTCIRLLMNDKGANLANNVSHDQLSSQCKKLDKVNARLVLKSEEKTVKAILNKAKLLAEKSGNEIILKTLESMKQEQTDEVSRLESLKKINPNVRPEEITYLNRQTELLEKYIGETEVKLESVRVIVAV